MREFRLIQVAVLSLACSVGSPSAEVTPETPNHETTLASFIAAFNSQDAAAMGRLVTDDVQWLSIDGTSVAVETTTKQELLVSMAKYFKSCPSCRSSVFGVVATADRLSALSRSCHASMKQKP